MKKMLSKVLCVVLVILLTAAVLPVTLRAAGDYDGKTVVLYTGNIRGNVALLPLVAAVRADFEARGADVILVDTGNFLQGTRYTSFNSGTTMITLMVLAGYDVVALGTYDFAFGTGAISAARMAELHGDVVDFGPLGKLLEMNPGLRAVSANISGVNEFFHNFTANTVITTDSGVEVGFFGLTDTATPDFILESNLVGMQFTNPTAAATAQADLLAGADVLVALSNANAGAFPGVIMLENTSVPLPGVPTVGALVIDNATGAYERRSIDLGAVSPDPFLAGIIAEFKAEVNEAFPRVFQSTVLLDGSIAANRSGETNLGNLWADALRWFAVSGEINAYFGEDDVAAGNNRIHVPAENIVALWNAGNLRDFLYPGEVILQDLRRVLPFPNTVAVVYLTGAELLEQLEASAQGVPHSDATHALSASFMHVSGIVYTVDTGYAFNPGVPYRDRIWYTAASVERVTITSINGLPFDENALYAVITSNANFNGMDISYVLFARENDVQNWSTITTARVVDHAVMGYIAQLPNATVGAVQAEIQGRITVGAAQRAPLPTPQPTPAPQPEPTPGFRDVQTAVLRMAIGSYVIDGFSGTDFEVDAAPFRDAAGRVMVPLRGAAQGFGASVQWVRETASAMIVTADGQTIEINVNEQLVINGRTFVTAEFIAALFNTGITELGGTIIIFYQ